MAYSDWITAGRPHVNTFGNESPQKSQFWLLTEYCYERNRNTVNYKIRLTLQYRYNSSSSTGTGTYNYKLGVKCKFNGEADPGYTQISGGGTWSSVKGSYTDVGSHTYTKSLTNTTGTGTVPIQVYTNRTQTNAFDNPGWYTYNLTIPEMDNFTITYNSNGGNDDVPAKQTKEPGQSVTIPDSTPTKNPVYNNSIDVILDGNGGAILGVTSPISCKRNRIYTFSHWNTAADGSGITYHKNDEYSDDADVILYAQWSPSYSAYESITFPDGFRQNYALDGWSTSTSGTAQYSIGDTYTPTATATFHALWTQQSPVLRVAQEVYDLMWPVGSVYMTTYSWDPGQLFGGTWVRYTPDPFTGIHVWERTA